MDEALRKYFLLQKISGLERILMMDNNHLDSVWRQRKQRFCEFYSDFSEELWNHNPQYLNYLMTKFYENINPICPRRYLTRATSCLFGSGNTSITLDQVKGFVRHSASLIPDILADFDFESSSQVAFAINLKNLNDFLHYVLNSPNVDPEEEEAFLSCYGLTRADFLPRVFAQSIVPPVALVNVCDGVNYRFVDVARVLSIADYNWMRMWIKYGVIDRPTTIPHFFAELLNDYKYCLAAYGDFMFQNQDPDDPQVAEMAGILQDAESDYVILRENEVFRFHERSSETKVRRFQTISYVTPILRHCSSMAYMGEYEYDEDRFLKDVNACPKLFFEASAQPYVTTHEIKELLEQSSDVGRKISHFPVCREKIDECIEGEYRKVFPECDIKQPRSLKDLSRRALRSALCQMGQLPKVLDRLEGLPQSLKKYCFIV